MFSMKWFILFLLTLNFVSAVNIDFDCPNNIFVDEEFECSLEVFDGSGEYDVKIDLDGERNSALQIWNGGKWESGYYYLKEFVEDGDDYDIRLRISEEGDYDGILKLRQGDKRDFFDINIEVEENEEDDKEEKGDEVITYENTSLSEDVPTILSLNSNVNEDKIVFISKNAKVVDFLPYGFSLFLIFIIVVLLWERF